MTNANTNSKNMTAPGQVTAQAGRPADGGDLWADFKNIARQFPDRTAIEAGDLSLSYRDLEARADGAANAILEAGADRGTVVAAYLAASVEHVVLLLAALKSGVAFMALNTREPNERLRHILSVAHPAAFATIPALREEWAARSREIETAAGSPVLHIERDGRVAVIRPNTMANRPPPVLVPDAEAGDVAYVMTTSGSTGRPKAIAGSRRGLRHFLRWEIAEFAVDPSDRISLLAPPTFDVSLRDTLVPLLAGGTLCIPDDTARFDPARLLSWFENSRITHAHMVPTTFRLLTREATRTARSHSGSPLPHLRRLLLAGEPLYGDDVIAWRRAAGAHVELVNLYGPTETTLAKLFHRIAPDDAVPDVCMPLGKPIPDTEIFIVQEGTCCAPGETGEIYIKTPYRSHGYVGNPDANREAFVTYPPDITGHGPAYRTGDLGFLAPDGTVRFAGRSDGQVKLHGNRVELSEIEVVLRRHPLVKEAAVACRTDGSGEPRLYGYIAAESSSQPSLEDLRDLLARNLPDYMMPSVFVFLPELPRTHSGKVDRKSLPDAAGRRPDLKQAYQPPGNAIERKLTEIWLRVLAIDRVGIDDNFFEVGGTSVLAASVAGQAAEALNVDLSVVTLFRHPSIRRLAGFLTDGAAGPVQYQQFEERARQRKTASKRRRALGGDSAHE